MADKKDPNVQDYADRIAQGLRDDGYKNQLTAIDVLLIGSRYGVKVEGKASTIKDISLLVAYKVFNPN